MHPIKQLGCRALQLAFRAALPILPYRQPKLLDSLLAVPGTLLERRIVSVLLVCDGGVRDLGLTAPLEQALRNAGVFCAVYEQRTPNPTIGNVEAARRIYLACGAKAIIAVGGGSAIDCAGLAFTRSYVGYVHGIAHSLGGQYGIAHGLANAVILPHVLRAYGDSCTKKLAALARCAGIALPEDDDVCSSRAFISWIDGLNRYFSLPESFPEIRIGDIPLMADRADRECNPLYPVPRLMDRSELEALYDFLIPKEERP